MALVGLVAACGGASPSATPAPATPTAAVASTVAPTSVAITTVPGTPAPPTSPPATAISSGPALVDLAFSGTRVFFANGTSGTCMVVSVGGVTRFGFEASKDDYPALGERFAVGELDAVTIKWTLDPNLAYANDPDVVIQISPDHRTVTLDQDLAPIAAGGTTPGPQHVKGTISCL